MSRGYRPPKKGLQANIKGLLLDGKPWRGVGVNHFQLFFSQYGELLSPPGTLPAANIDNDFDLIRSYGMTVARVPVGFFSASDWWNKYYINPAAKADYYARVDSLIDKAEQHGVGLILNLCWHPIAVSDVTWYIYGVCDGPVKLGVPGSNAWGLMTGFITEFVARYKDRDIIYGWEFGNEFSSQLGPEFWNNWPVNGQPNQGGTDYTGTLISANFSNGVTISGGEITVPSGVSSFTMTAATTGGVKKALTIGATKGVGTVTFSCAVTTAILLTYTIALTGVSPAGVTVHSIALSDGGANLHPSGGQTFGLFDLGKKPDGQTNYFIADKLTAAGMHRMMQHITDTFHANDPYGRIVLSGNADGNSFAVSGQQSDTLSTDVEAKWEGQAVTENMPWLCYINRESPTHSTHLYSSSGETDPQATWAGNNMTYIQRLNYAKAKATQASKPFILSETGSSWQNTALTDTTTTTPEMERQRYEDMFAATLANGTSLVLLWNFDGSFEGPPSLDWPQWSLTHPSRAYILGLAQSANNAMMVAAGAT